MRLLAAILCRVLDNVGQGHTMPSINLVGFSSLERGVTMRRIGASLVVVSVLLVLVLSGQQVSVDGELVSAKCYLREGLTGNDHLGMKDCGTACAKSGNPVGLLTSEGRYYTLGNTFTGNRRPRRT